MTKNSSPSERDLDRIERHVEVRKTIVLREGALKSTRVKAIKEQAAAYSKDALTAIREPSKILRDPKTGVEIAAANDDVGPRERLNHHAIALEGDRLTHGRVLSATVLDRMLNRRELAFDKTSDHKRLWNAGERFRNDLMLAYAEPRVIADLSGLPGGALLQIADARSDAKKRLRRVMISIGHPMFRLLEQVIRYDLTPKHAVMQRFCRRAHDPMANFRWAIEELAQHYGY